MNNLHNRLIFDIVNKNKIPGKNLLKVIKFQVENIVMCGKYSLTKFATFLYIVLRAGIVTTFGSKTVTISTQNLRTLQSYIFHILQHFATKFWNSTFEKFKLDLP